jgi:hypothetical protein
MAELPFCSGYFFYSADEFFIFLSLAWFFHKPDQKRRSTQVATDARKAQR